MDSHSLPLPREPTRHRKGDSLFASAASELGFGDRGRELTGWSLVGLYPMAKSQPSA